MASNVLRSHWTNDSGTPVAPVGNGTQINEAQLQLIYANIDELFLRSSIIFGGVLTMEGLGVHSFVASGVGAQVIALRNSAAGGTNYSQLQIGNNAAPIRTDIFCTSTTYSAGGTGAFADVLGVRSNGVNGISIISGDVLGDIRFYPRGLTTSMLTLGTSTASINAFAPVMQQVPGTGGAIFGLRRTDNGADEKQYLIRIVGTDLRIEASNDVLSAVSSWVNFTRTGAVPTAAQFGCDVVPLVNTYKIGTSTSKWAEGWFADVRAGDVTLENDFAVSEHDKVGVKTPGIAFLNPKRSIIGFLREDGRFFANGYSDLAELEME